MWVDALVILGGYLFGAFPVVYLLGRMRGFDLSKEEDMHISLWRKVGRREGFIGITWDIVKGGVAVGLLRIFYLDSGHWGTVVGVGVAIVVGRMWSVFLRFRGEKANTTSLGVEIALAYQATAFVLVPILLGVTIRTLPRMLDSRQSVNERLRFGGPPSLSLPLAMLVAFAMFPIGCWYYDQPWTTTVAGAAIFVLIVVKRLSAGLLDELKTATASTGSILLNRALFDRSYI
jgi:glycerol-3-phosphate acyltransferase PlsY